MSTERLTKTPCQRIILDLGSLNNLAQLAKCTILFSKITPPFSTLVQYKYARGQATVEKGLTYCKGITYPHLTYDKDNNTMIQDNYGTSSCLFI